MNSRLDFQPEFPARDISDDTAAILEELLRNQDAVALGHTQAELTNFIYRIGHRMFHDAAGVELDAAQLAAFSSGIRLYETTSGLVRPDTSSIDEAAAMRHINAMSRELASDASINTIIDARDVFLTDLPRAAYVLARSATFFAATHPDYLVGGAAIARQVELRAINDPSSLEDQFDFPTAND